MRTLARRRSRGAGPLALVAALLGLLLLLAPAASAAGGLDDAATALKQGRVYVDPAMAGRFGQGRADALTEKIRKADKPIFVAVVPAADPYGASTVFDDLRTKVGITGTYAIWRGDQFQARSDKEALPPRAPSGSPARPSARTPATSTPPSTTSWTPPPRRSRGTV